MRATPGARRTLRVRVRPWQIFTCNNQFERDRPIETSRGRIRLSGKRAQRSQRREGAEREERTSRLTTTPILDHHPMLHERSARTDIQTDIQYSPSRLPEGAGGEGTRIGEPTFQPSFPLRRSRASARLTRGCRQGKGWAVF